jgi:hypothetical protein
MTGATLRRYPLGVPPPCLPARAVFALLVVAALALSGCYSFAQPSFRPGEARDVVLTLALRGVEVETAVSGGSACSDPAVLGNALHLVVSMPPDPARHDLYIYTFRPRNWDGTAPAIDACQAEYAAAHPGEEVTRIDIPTYRAFGAGWPEPLQDAVRRALEDASERGD